jgi:hypothetical protein
MIMFVVCAHTIELVFNIYSYSYSYCNTFLGRRQNVLSADKPNVESIYTV